VDSTAVKVPSIQSDSLFGRGRRLDLAAITSNSLTKLEFTANAARMAKTPGHSNIIKFRKLPPSGKSDRPCHNGSRISLYEILRMALSMPQSAPMQDGAVSRAMAASISLQRRSTRLRSDALPSTISPTLMTNAGSSRLIFGRAFVNAPGRPRAQLGRTRGRALPIRRLRRQ
jgi:hypothetical protein